MEGLGAVFTVVSVVVLGTAATLYILKERYFASANFLSHKAAIASVVTEHNDIAFHVSEIRGRGSCALGASSTGSQARMVARIKRADQSVCRGTAAHSISVLRWLLVTVVAGAGAAILIGSGVAAADTGEPVGSSAPGSDASSQPSASAATSSTEASGPGRRVHRGAALGAVSAASVAIVPHPAPAERRSSVDSRAAAGQPRTDPTAVVAAAPAPVRKAERAFAPYVGGGSDVEAPAPAESVIVGPGAASTAIASEPGVPPSKPVASALAPLECDWCVRQRVTIDQAIVGVTSVIERVLDSVTQWLAGLPAGLFRDVLEGAVLLVRRVLGQSGLPQCCPWGDSRPEGSGPCGPCSNDSTALSAARPTPGQASRAGTAARRTR